MIYYLSYILTDVECLTIDLTDVKLTNTKSLNFRWHLT